MDDGGEGAETLPLIGSLLRRCVALSDVHVLLQLPYVHRATFREERL
jgi:hypothetical protein